MFVNVLYKFNYYQGFVRLIDFSKVKYSCDLYF